MRKKKGDWDKTTPNFLTVMDKSNRNERFLIIIPTKCFVHASILFYYSRFALNSRALIGRDALEAGVSNRPQNKRGDA